MYKKIYVYLITFFMFINSYSNVMEIKDKYNLIKQKNIEYNTEEELSKKLEDILIKLHEKGFTYSNFKFENGSMIIKNKVITEVQYEDNNNKFLKLKKYINNLNLEGEVFNIKKIDKIIEKFNSNESNNVFLDVYEDGEKGVKLKFTNKYKTNNKFSVGSIISISNGSKSIFNILNINADQNLGLNENLDVTLGLNNNDNLLFNIALKLNDISLSNKFNYIKSDDVRTVSNNLNLKIEKGISETNIAFKTKSQKVKDVNILNLKFLELGTELKFKNFTPRIETIFAFDNNKYEDMYLSLGAKFNYEWGVYSLEGELGKIFSINNKEIYNNSLFSNELSYSTYPVEYSNSTGYIVLDNKIRVIRKYKDLIYIPFVEGAFSYTDEGFDLGYAVGIELLYKKLTLGAKYSQNIKNNKNLSMKINYSF